MAKIEAKISDSFHKKVKAAAKKAGESLAQFIRNALSEKMNRK